MRTSAGCKVRDTINTIKCSFFFPQFCIHSLICPLLGFFVCELSDINYEKYFNKIILNTRVQVSFVKLEWVARRTQKLLLGLKILKRVIHLIALIKAFCKIFTPLQTNEKAQILIPKIVFFKLKNEKKFENETEKRL